MQKCCVQAIFPIILSSHDPPLLSLAGPDTTVVASSLGHLPVTGTRGKFEILGEIPSIFTAVAKRLKRGKTAVVKSSLRQGSDVLHVHARALCAPCTLTALIRECCDWMDFLCQWDFSRQLKELRAFMR